MWYEWEIISYYRICDTVEYVGLLNEIWMWNYIIKLKFWEGWIFGTVEWDYTVESDKTVEFVTSLNIWICWVRYNVNKIIILDLLHFWICGTVE